MTAKTLTSGLTQPFIAFICLCCSSGCNDAPNQHTIKSNSNAASGDGRVDLNSKFPDMYAAVWRDNVEAVKELLVKYPGLEEFSNGAMSSWLDVAAGRNSVGVVRVLFERGWTASSTPAGRKIHPLWKAKGEHYEMAKFLLDKGADPNIERSLIGAINSEDSLKWVKLFVEYGADVNWCVLVAAPKPYWATPLSWAKDLGKQDVVDYLLSKGAVMPDHPKANRQPKD